MFKQPKYNANNFVTLDVPNQSHNFTGFTMQNIPNNTFTNQFPIQMINKTINEEKIGKLIAGKQSAQISSRAKSTGKSRMQMTLRTT